MENGRIIIDPHAHDIHCMPGPNLEPIDTRLQLNSADGDILHDEDHNVVYKATSLAFRKYQEVLGKWKKFWEKDITGRGKPFLLPYWSDS